MDPAFAFDYVTPGLFRRDFQICKTGVCYPTGLTICRAFALIPVLNLTDFDLKGTSAARMMLSSPTVSGF
jgi:hypothetical protein